MREIKFRAWNIKEERMIQNIQQEYDGREEDCFAQFIEQEANHGRSGEKGKYHVMQYTGLKDKNGVEIYEGDILSITRDELGSCLPEYEHMEYKSQFHHETITVTRTAEVLYGGDGWGGFKMRYFDYYHTCPDTGKLVEGFIDKDGEVVGNIFEGVDK